MKKARRLSREASGVGTRPNQALWFVQSTQSSWVATARQHIPSAIPLWLKPEPSSVRSGESS